MLSLLLGALAAFTVLVVRRRGPAVSEEALGFGYVGAAGLVLLAVAVVTVGQLSAVPGRAESLALLGFAAYLIYLLAAWAVIRLRRSDGERIRRNGSGGTDQAEPINP